MAGGSWKPVTIGPGLRFKGACRAHTGEAGSEDDRE